MVMQVNKNNCEQIPDNYKGDKINANIISNELRV